SGMMVVVESSPCSEIVAAVTQALSSRCRLARCCPSVAVEELVDRAQPLESRPLPSSAAYNPLTIRESKASMGLAWEAH
ncbi:hypothetical protein Dimus_030687, partial [Dionaea muscipula]